MPIFELTYQSNLHEADESHVVYVGARSRKDAHTKFMLSRFASGEDMSSIKVSRIVLFDLPTTPHVLLREYIVRCHNWLDLDVVDNTFEVTIKAVNQEMLEYETKRIMSEKYGIDPDYVVIDRWFHFGIFSFEKEIPF